MSAVNIDLPFTASTSLSFTLDEQRLGQVVCPIAVSASPDEAALIDRALESPLGTPRLEEMVRPGQRVLILTDDNTRPTPVHRILPHILERLQGAGLGLSNIEILIAAGTHRPMTDAEIQAKLGPEVVQSVRVTRHDCYDTPSLMKAGIAPDGVEVWLNRAVAQADFVMAIGNVVPHPHTGWSGGAKILYPGVAGADTIAAFHRAGIEDPTNQLGRDDAPARYSLEMLAATVGLDFIVNTVLTPDYQLYRVFCGEPHQAQAAARQASRQVYGVPVHSRYDVVVSNAYPAYLEFWQASKGIFPADLILKPGGTIILTASCPEGIGVTHPDQVEYLALDLPELMRRITAHEVQDPIAACVCVKTVQVRARARVVVVSPGLNGADVRTMGFEPYTDLEEAVESVLVAYGPESTLAVIPHGGETVPYVI